MKFYFLSLTVIALLSSVLNAQSDTSSTGYKPDNTDLKQKILEKQKNYDINFDIANHEAFYAEGDDSLFRFIYSNLTIPDNAVSDNLSASAIVSFQVNFDGKVSQSHSISRVGYGIDEQIIILLNNLEFVPATQSNTSYRSEVILEIPIKAVYIRNVFK